MAEVKQEKQEFKKEKVKVIFYDVPTFSHVTGQRWTVISRSAFFPFFFFNNEGGGEEGGGGGGGWWCCCCRRCGVSKYPVFTEACSYCLKTKRLLTSPLLYLPDYERWHSHFFPSSLSPHISLFHSPAACLSLPLAGHLSL